MQPAAAEPVASLPRSQQRAPASSLLLTSLLLQLRTLLGAMNTLGARARLSLSMALSSACGALSVIQQQRLHKRQQRQQQRAEKQAAAAREQATREQAAREQENLKQLAEEQQRKQQRKLMERAQRKSGQKVAMRPGKSKRR